MILHDALETERLTIRPFVAADAPLLVDLFADPAVARFVDDGTGLSPAMARLWVERSGENLARYGYGTGAVIEKASGALIGWAGFARPGDGSEEIIYGLAVPHWHRGFGGEIVAGLLAFAQQRGIDPVRATVDAENLRSIAILERHGFRLAARDYGGDAGSSLFVRRCGPDS